MEIEKKLVAIACNNNNDNDLPSHDQISILRFEYLDWCHQAIISKTIASPSKTANLSETYEDRAWELVFSQPIDRLIFQLHSAINKKLYPEAEVLTRSLLTAISEASGFYHSILSVLQEYTVLDANVGLKLRFGRLDEDNQANRVATIAHCLAHLGTLENYTHFANHGGSPSSNSFPHLARNLYLSSMTIKPTGKVCSQMGAIYTAHNRPLLACYWYIHGITNRDPSTICATNLALLFKQLATNWNKGAANDLQMAFIHHILSPAIVRGPLVNIKPSWFIGFFDQDTSTSFLSTLVNRLSKDNAILIVEMLMAALCKIMPKDSDNASRDLFGWHVSRGLLIALILTIASIHQEACMILATWTMSKSGKTSLTEALDTSKVFEVQSRLAHDWNVELPEIVSYLISTLPHTSNLTKQPAWVPDLDSKLCQYACLNDIYEKILPPHLPSSSINQNSGTLNTDPVRLDALKMVLNPYRVQST